MNDLEFNKLIKSITTNQCGSKLSIEKQSFTSAQIQLLANSLSLNSSIIDLSFWECDLGDIGAKALADALSKNTSVRLLNLKSNKIGDAGLTAIAQTLTRNSSISLLILTHNVFGDKGVKALAQALTQNSTLRALELGFNHKESKSYGEYSIQSNGAIALAQALSKNTGLHHLKLDHADIGSSGGKAFAQTLVNNSSLVILQLLSCNIGNSGAKAFADALLKNSSLRCLNLIANGLDMKSSNALIQALSKNPTQSLYKLYMREVGLAFAHSNDIPYSTADSINQITQKAVEKDQHSIQKSFDEIMRQCEALASMNVEAIGEMGHNIFLGTHTELVDQGEYYLTFLEYIYGEVKIKALRESFESLRKRCWDNYNSYILSGLQLTPSDKQKAMTKAAVISKLASSVQETKKKAEVHVSSPVDELIQKATAGDPKSQYKLAMRYAKGKDVEKNEQRAFGWFQKAALQGHAPSQHALGIAYVYEKGARKDDTLGLKWLQKAASQGHEAAQQEIEKLRLSSLSLINISVHTEAKLESETKDTADQPVAVLQGKSRLIQSDDDKSDDGKSKHYRSQVESKEKKEKHEKPSVSISVDIYNPPNPLVQYSAQIKQAERRESTLKEKVITFQGSNDHYTLKYKIERRDVEAIFKQTGFEVPLPPGKECLSNYVMGRGGFGEFCVGFAEKQNGYVGIKINKGSGNVKNEVALYNALSHQDLQHILPIIDQYETVNDQGEVVLYQVMELAGLGSTDKLKDALNLISDSHFKDQVLFCLAEGLLQGLFEMHLANFFHLDVKPNNLVIRQDGRVFLIDFGCSVQSDKALIDMTGKIGDRRYFSPERQQAVQFCDVTKIDAFAAGLTLLYLGESQFKSDEIEHHSTNLLREIDLLLKTTDKKELGETIQQFYEKQAAKVPFLQNPKPDSFWSLVSGLLTFDLKKRLTPEQALKHSWFIKMKLASKEWRKQTTEYLRELVQAAQRERRDVGAQDLPLPHFTSFVERPSVQQQILQRLLKESCEKSAITVCQGMGGVGKTQLVNFILNLDVVQNNFGTKLWFRNADNASLLDVQIVSLARELRLIDAKANCEEARKKFHIHLAAESKETGKPWLIIFDNAEEQELLQPYFPPEGGHCLVTTRNAGWKDVSEIVIDVMTETEAEALVNKLLQKKELDALTLCRALGFLPLAIVQACAYITAEGLTISVYLEKLQKESSALSLLERDERSFGKKLPASMLGVWQMTFQTLSKYPDALQVLDRLSYLSPDAIDGSLLASLGPYSAFKVLHKYALIQVNSEGMVLVHRLLQLAVRAKNEVRASDILVSVSRGILDDVLIFMPETVDAIKENTRLFPHAEYVCQAIQKETAPSQVLLQNFSKILSWLGDRQEELGAPVRSEEYYRRALIVNKKIYGKDHWETAISLNRMGMCCRTSGDNEKAMNYFERALTILEKTKDKEDATQNMIASILHNIGQIFLDSGDAESAVNYFERALFIYKKNKTMFTKDKQGIASILTGLGVSYKMLGNAKKAVEYHHSALDIREEIFSEDHPEIAKSLNNLGEAYRVLKFPQKAVEYLERALTIDKKIYGDEHPSVATVYNNLGLSYQDLRDSKKAIKYHKKALAIYEKTYGQEHRSVALSLGNLGASYYSLEDYKTSVEYNERSIAVLKKVHGNTHPQIAINCYNLAQGYRELGNMDKAIQSLKETLTIEEINFGRDHPEVAKTRELLREFEKQRKVGAPFTPLRQAHEDSMRETRAKEMEDKPSSECSCVIL